MTDPPPDAPLPFFKVGNIATGFIAVGNVAHGFVAIGFSVAVGPIAIGLNAVSPFLAIGLNSAGLISISAINAVGLFSLAGVNALGAFGVGGVNSGVHPLLGILVAVASLVAVRFVPAWSGASKPPPEVPGERVSLEAFVSGGVSRGWVEARIVKVEDGILHLRQDGTRVEVQAEGGVTDSVLYRVGARPRGGYFEVAAVEELSAPEEGGYRIGPNRRRRLVCERAIYFEPPAPWWTQAGGLRKVNRVVLVGSAVISFAASIAGLI